MSGKYGEGLHGDLERLADMNRDTDQREPITPVVEPSPVRARTPGIVDVVWFTPQGKCIGIVLYFTGYGHKCYLGVAEGYDADADARDIADLGVPFHCGSGIWPSITDWQH